MTTRHLMYIGAAAGTLVAATPALAQPEMTYEQQQAYEYARPAPPQAAPVVWTQQPVVQPIPARQAVHSAPVQYETEEYEVEYEYGNAAPVHHARHVAPAHHTPVHTAPVHHAPVRHPMPHHGAQVPQQPSFDRDAWLDECEDRYDDGRRGRGGNGNVVGGLLGAAAGGLIGNRVAGRGDRLAGSLIGAGVGGLAGLAVGSAVDSAGRRSRRGDARAYCEDWLARYSGGYGHHGGYGYQHGYYGYGYTYQLVPVMITVPQRAVVREYVTEEVVYEEVTTYEEAPVRYRKIERRAPAPVKRVPIKTKRTKYRKGN